MKIDAHQHFWKYNPIEYGWINEEMPQIKRDFLPEDLQPLLEKSGMDGCVAVQARQSLEETRFLLQLADQNDFIKGVVGWVDLKSKKVEEQLREFIGQEKFKGVRHVIQDEADDQFILNEDFMRGIAKLQKYNLTYDILVFPKHLPHVLTFLASFPDQPFVIDHIAKPDIKNQLKQPWADQMRQIAQFKNVHCKISGMVTEAAWNSWQQEDFIFYLDTIFEAFGEDRIMVGSDWPVCLLAASNYHDVIHIIDEYMERRGLVDRNKIFGLNAINFYNL